MTVTMSVLSLITIVLFWQAEIKAGMFMLIFAFACALAMRSAFTRTILSFDAFSKNLTIYRRKLHSINSQNIALSDIDKAIMMERPHRRVDRNPTYLIALALHDQTIHPMMPFYSQDSRLHTAAQAINSWLSDIDSAGVTH